MKKKRNIDRVLECILEHPEGIDDDDEISAATGIRPRQQVHQLATRLASQGLTRRETVNKPGKRQKIQNFPARTESSAEIRLPGDDAAGSSSGWKRRLAAPVAATGFTEERILDEALTSYARTSLSEQIDGR